MVRPDSLGKALHFQVNWYRCFQSLVLQIKQEIHFREQEPHTFSPSPVNFKCSALQVSLLFNYNSPMVVNKFVSSTHVSLLFNYSTLSSNLISFKSSVHIQLSLQQIYTSGSRNTSQVLSLCWGFRRCFLSPLPPNWLKTLRRFSEVYIDQVTCMRAAQAGFFLGISSHPSSCPTPAAGVMGVLSVRTPALFWYKYTNFNFHQQLTWQWNLRKASSLSVAGWYLSPFYHLEDVQRTGL